MTLLYIYIASFILGGVLLGASLLLGTDKDFDAADMDADVDLGVDVDADGDVDLHVDGDHGADIWLPFLSLRFWVFFLAFFGATGAVLTLLALASKWVTFASALGMGGVIGFAAAYIVQRLKRDVVGEVATVEHYKGLEGTVLLPVSSELRGKVRLTVRGQAVDFKARTDSAETLEIGTQVLVIDVDANEVVVVPASDIDAPRPRLKALPPAQDKAKMADLIGDDPVAEDKADAEPVTTKREDT